VRERGATLVRQIETVLRDKIESFLRLGRPQPPASEAADDARVTALRGILDRLIDDRLFPRAFEYDYLDDLSPIIAGRYAAGDGGHVSASRRILQAIAVIAGSNERLEGAALVAGLKQALGADHGYEPRKGAAHPVVKQIIPDLWDEFISMKASAHPARFIEINREYSLRQRWLNGKWGPVGLSLLLGHERNHHVMIRTLIDLRNEGALRPDDEVLVIGPRHFDEIAFFRNHLGLPKTTGLDLFDSRADGIVGGDMHAMPFDAGRFRLVYCSGTLSYSYAIRTVFSETVRVLKRPGYLLFSDAGQRSNGVDALGRTDPVSADAIIGCFHEHRFDVLFRDDGMSPDLSRFQQWPSVGLKLF
jgi:SAM-dependent methyltransferase